MTNDELNEIKAAIEKIKHCEGLEGKYYELQRAVLPLLENAIEYERCIGLFRDGKSRPYGSYEYTLMYSTISRSLSIVRVINKKYPITEYKGGAVKAVADIKNIKAKQPPRLSKAKIRELKAKGQIK